MNKNVVIGLLAAVIIIGGGYLLIKNNQNTSPAPYVTPTSTGNNTSTTSSYTPPATTTAPTAPLTISTPTVETNPNVTASTSSALVTGQVVPNGAQTTYWFEYGPTTSLGAQTAAQQIGSAFYSIAAPAFITNLASNTTYYFRLAANNNLGTAYGTTYTFMTNQNPPPVVSLPTVHTNNATDITRTSATGNGQVNPNGLTTNYWFEYGIDSTLGNITSINSISASNSTSNLSAGLSNLNPLTKYYFRLYAQNQFGTVSGNTLSFTTAGPLNPGIPVVTTNSATNVQTSTAQVNGRINPESTDTTYWFEYSQDSSLANVTSTPVQSISASTSTTTVETDIMGLNNDTKYYYHLVARNQYGTVYGNTVSFTTRH